MTGVNLEKKLETKEVLGRDIAKNFSLFAAIASDPSEKIKIGDDKIGVYGLEAMNTVLGNISDETKEYLGPVFSGLVSDYNQNKEFSKHSKDIFKFYSEMYEQKILTARGMDVIKMAEEHGLEKDDVAKQLTTSKSFSELIEQYVTEDYAKNTKEKKDWKPEKAEELRAHGVTKSIEYILEYLKNNAKGRIWNETVASRLKDLKSVSETPKDFVKAAKKK